MKAGQPWRIPQRTQRKWRHDREYRNRRCGHRPRDLRRCGRASPARAPRSPSPTNLSTRSSRAAPASRQLAARPDARLRSIHRLRRTRHPAYPPRATNPVTAQPDSLTRRRIGCRGRARSRQRDDAAAVVDAGHRPHRCAARGRADVCGDAVRRTDARRLRVRQPWLLRRSRAAGPRRAGRHGRRFTSALPTANCCRPPRRWPSTASSRWCSPRRRGWR